MIQEENKIQAVPDFEAGSNQSMCEIRFDCLVTMFERGSRTIKTGIFGFTEKQLPPQWFKSQSKITLEGIRFMDEYTLGKQLKDMLHQLDKHIENYENN